MTEKKEMKQKNEVKEVLMFTPVIETVGTRLKKCREEKKIELSEISKALCIRESFLVALEEGEYEGFPALVYAGGFLRSYAVYLGMDDKEVMQQFHKETEYLIEKSSEMPVVSAKNIIPSKKLLVSLMLLIVVGWASIGLMNKEDAVETKDEMVVQTPVVVEQSFETPVVASQELAVQQEGVVSPSETPVVPVQSLSQELKEAVPGVQQEAENPFSGTVYGVTEGARVSVLATDTVWVEVKSGDKVVFTRVLKKGDSYNPENAEEAFVLRTGNAGAISIYVDGVFKKVLGRTGHVLKDIKLVPESFVD